MTLHTNIERFYTTQCKKTIEWRCNRTDCILQESQLLSQSLIVYFAVHHGNTAYYV